MTKFSEEMRQELNGVIASIQKEMLTKVFEKYSFDGVKYVVVGLASKAGIHFKDRAPRPANKEAPAEEPEQPKKKSSKAK